MGPIPRMRPIGGDSRVAQVPNASPSRIRADKWGPLVSLSLCCSLALSGWWPPGVSNGFSTRASDGSLVCGPGWSVAFVA